MSGIDFVDYPPGRDTGTKFVRVAVLPASTKLYFRILGRWRGVITHWVSAPKSPTGKAQTIPCRKASGQCTPCEAGIVGRWYAFLPCLLYHCSQAGGEWWEPVILPLPESSVTPLCDLTTLRGQVIAVERGPRRTGPLMVTVCKGGATDMVLPPCFDVGAILARLWGCGSSATGSPQGAADSQPGEGAGMGEGSVADEPPGHLAPDVADLSDGL